MLYLDGQYDDRSVGLARKKVRSRIAGRDLINKPLRGVTQGNPQLSFQPLQQVRLHTNSLVMTDITKLLLSGWELLLLLISSSSGE